MNQANGQFLSSVFQVCKTRTTSVLFPSLYVLLNRCMIVLCTQKNLSVHIIILNNYHTHPQIRLFDLPPIKSSFLQYSVREYLHTYLQATQNIQFGLSVTHIWDLSIYITCDGVEAEMESPKRILHSAKIILCIFSLCQISPMYFNMKVFS